jgi:signal transduction histidine kinase
VQAPANEAPSESAAAPPAEGPRLARDRLRTLFLVVFASALGAIFVGLFYGSPLRERVENKLFDIRTRLAPTLAHGDLVAIVTIDDAAIAALGGRPKAEGKPADLPPSAWRAIAEAALAAPAREVALLLPPQVLPYTDPALDDLARLAAAEPRLAIGVFDQTVRGLGAANLPAALQGAVRHTFRADLVREYRRDIVRQITLVSADELPYLVADLARRYAPEAWREAQATLPHDPRLHDDLRLPLNYFAPSSLPAVSAADLLAHPDRARRVLAGRIVLVGYTTYRPWNFQDREATFVNTPWQAEGADPAAGMPVVHVQAIALTNLLEHAWLRPASTWLNILSTLVLTVCALATWQLSIGFASVLFIGGWSVILLLHALLFATAHVDLALADAALWTSLATIVGALARLRVEGRMRVMQEARYRAEKAMALVEERFLDRFATELGRINGRVQQLLASLGGAVPEGGTTRDAYLRALGSSEELSEYLAGIEQFAAFREEDLARPTLVEVDVNAVVRSVLRHFEARRQEQGVRVELALSPEARALGDRTLVAQIAYNLISNAVKYAPPGSCITIATETAPGQVRLAVRDQGPGIDGAYHEKIFEKFYRVKDDNVYKVKGHGLGLYLSRFFAGKMQATIGLTSSVGQGATFVLAMRKARGG